MPNRILLIMLESLIALIIVLFFVGFGDTTSITGALQQDWHLLINTFARHTSNGSYSGVSWVSVWVSFRLIVMGTLFSCLFGFAYALFSVRLKNFMARRLNEFISTLLQSLPEAMYVVLVFSVLVYLLKKGINLPGLFYDGTPRLQDTLAPAIALGLPGALYLRRILGRRLEDETNAMYVSTALGKGLSESRAFYVHVLPNILPLAFRQIPVVAGFVISSALFAEFFLGYMGLLFHFMNFVGWDMNTGALGLHKPSGVPTYQPGAVFVVGILLVACWFLFQLISEAIAFIFPQDIEPSPTPQRGKINRPWIVSGSILILVVLFCAAFPNILTNNAPNAKHLLDTQNWTMPPYPPSHTFLLGTDAQGHDLLSRTLHGTLASLGQVASVTGLTLIGSLALASLIMLNPGSWFSKFILRVGHIWSAIPVLLIIFLALYNRNVLSHWQEAQFICWIALFEIGRGSMSFYGAMAEWNEFGFIEGAVSIGQRRTHILYRQLRSWLAQFALEFTFAEFARVLSLMTLLAMLHTYAVDKVVFLDGTPPVFAIGSGQITWFSILGDATNQVFAIVTHPFLIYAPVLALTFTMLGTSFIARGLRSGR